MFNVFCVVFLRIILVFCFFLLGESRAVRQRRIPGNASRSDAGKLFDTRVWAFDVGQPPPQGVVRDDCYRRNSFFLGGGELQQRQMHKKKERSFWRLLYPFFILFYSCFEYSYIFIFFTRYLASKAIFHRNILVRRWPFFFWEQQPQVSGLAK